MDTAYISTGLNFPDALAAAPPSALSNGPLLLVRPTAIPPVIVAELDRLEPGRIVILGGPGVVSNAVAAQLDAFTDGPVTRVYGSDRYQTAAAISSTFFGSAETAYVATGTTFPDALAGGSAGGQFLGPMLLVPGTSVPPSVVNELERFDPARIFILGGPGVVSNGVVSMISGLFH
jgi:putative cell wall-binding protein